MPARTLPLVLALALAAASPALAQDRDACGIASALTYAAVKQREGGASQREAARYLAAGIGEAAGGLNGSRAEQQHLANLLGGIATQLLRFAYTIRLDPRVDNPRLAGDTIFGMCMRGEL